MLGHGTESNPEELLDVFKAAALSVTKLYKTSAAVQSKARVDGYQDCLEDLLAVLDKGDVDARTIRRWVVERLDGREAIVPTVESEDEVEKTDSGVTPEPQSTAGNSGRQNEVSRSAGNGGMTVANGDTAMQTEVEAEGETETETETPSPSKKRTITTSTMATPSSSMTKKATQSKARWAAPTAPPASSTAPSTTLATEAAVEPSEVSVPMQDSFTFRSAVPYPTDSFLELANLDLSDRRSGSGSVKEASEPPSFASVATTAQVPTSTYAFNGGTTTTSETSSSPSHTSGSRQFRVRHGAARSAVRNALTSRGNRNTAGQKRKLNFDEIFDLASLGYGRDVFGRGGGKRSRQA